MFNWQGDKFLLDRFSMWTRFWTCTTCVILFLDSQCLWGHADTARQWVLQEYLRERTEQSEEQQAQTRAGLLGEMLELRGVELRRYAWSLALPWARTTHQHRFWCDFDEPLLFERDKRKPDPPPSRVIYAIRA